MGVPVKSSWCQPGLQKEFFCCLVVWKSRGASAPLFFCQITDADKPDYSRSFYALQDSPTNINRADFISKLFKFELAAGMRLTHFNLQAGNLADE